MKRCLRAVAAVGMIVSACPAFAGEADGPLWQKSCDPSAQGGTCWIEQFAVSMPEKLLALRVRVTRAAGEQLRIVLNAPLGVALQPGLQLVLDDGQPIALPFERCSAQGCEAGAILDEQAVARFSDGKSLVARYAVSNTDVTGVPIRLEGFADALKTLRK